MDIRRNEKGHFLKGNPPGPGRTPGKLSSLRKINTILIKKFEENKDKFLNELDEFIEQQGMIKYFDKYIAPRLPQTLDINAVIDSDTPEDKAQVLAYLDELKKNKKLDVSSL